MLIFTTTVILVVLLLFVGLVKVTDSSTTIIGVIIEGITCIYIVLYILMWLLKFIKEIWILL